MEETMPFGKYKNKPISEIPDTYLDYLMGEEWFIKNTRNKFLIKEIDKEIATRLRSGYFIEDDYGKTFLDI
jgi:uncharacterized protein (DUF3820 family)